ncbi:MAG: hypothetical protein ACOC83_07725 [Gemmatimonadota bacterium]
MPVVMRRLDAPTVRETSPQGYGPSVRCDACGKEIPKPAKGRVAWDPDENTTYLGTDFLHEGCVDERRKERGVDLRTARLSEYVESLECFVAGEGR